MAESKLQALLNHRAVAVIAPAVIGMGSAVFAIHVVEDYGLTLFVGIPFVVGFLAAFAWSYGRQVPYAKATGTAMLSLALLAAMVVVMALDGLICVIMAFPIAAVLTVLGAAIGHAVGMRAGGGPGSAALPLLLCAALPLLMGFERQVTGEHPLRAVTTSVVVDAPIERVWTTVIAFPPIDDPPQGVLRLGFAYPVSARIDGEGVGAIRYCTFSTGSFVEPITRWEQPQLLAFDVTAQPDPMRELSPYPALEPPHLHDHLVSQRGRFQLEALGDGRVQVSGTTWYTQHLAPEWYWGALSDAVIHRIHRRVLDHIKRVAEP